ncbi:hypothetical protein GWI33_008058 [Rhynchophorus ferrugineus]|uniref:Uncharacterized protein n=1 Tax=Rhynchophorus ferrugineus TaxID=354439 RepID=A0A834IH80_RHYFE|nr:hypothetical protein GWI33_008058 [Rhynchophorus ferrugineus]
MLSPKACTGLIKTASQTFISIIKPESIILTGCYSSRSLSRPVSFGSYTIHNLPGIIKELLFLEKLANDVIPVVNREGFPETLLFGTKCERHLTKLLLISLVYGHETRLSSEESETPPVSGSFHPR